MKLLFHSKIEGFLFCSLVTVFCEVSFVKSAQKQPNQSLFLQSKYIFHLICFNPLALYAHGLHHKIFKQVISKVKKKSVQNKNSVLGIMFITFSASFLDITSADPS